MQQPTPATKGQVGAKKGEQKNQKEQKGKEQKQEQRQHGMSQEARCYRCNFSGHVAANCRTPSRLWAPRPPASHLGACRLCGVFGHYAAACATPPRPHSPAPAPRTFIPGSAAARAFAEAKAAEDAAQADLAAASAAAQSASFSVARLGLCARAFAERGGVEELEAALRKQLLASAAAFAEEIAEHAPAAASLAAGLRRQQRGDQTPCPFCARTFPADALAAHVREGHFESARAAYVATESAERAAIAAARAASAKNLLERAVAERAAITKAKKRRAEETTAETKARAAIEVEEALAFRNLLRRNRRGPKRAREETTENQTVDTTTDHTRPPQPEEQPVIDAPGPDDSPPPPEERPLDDETAEEQAPDDNPPKPAEQPPNNGTAAQHAPPGNPPPAEQQPEHATTAPAPKGTKKKQAKKAEDKPQPKQPRKLTAPRLDHKAVEAAKGFTKHKSQIHAADRGQRFPLCIADARVGFCGGRCRA
jgi:hypothetical protein